ncbi:MAG: ATP-binding protein [Candidatus Brocadiales bacterium]|nr:ATP-binding protein [Candidatus Brocadiales bacterium]
MKYFPRLITSKLKTAVKHFPALIVTGPRRAGKTTLLRKCFPHASYHLIEDPDIIARLRSDPRSYIDTIKLPAILDEIQNVPELLNYIRTRVDQSPHKNGQWLLTGSQEAPLMQGVSESMAGRAAIFQLLPFSQEETSKVSIFRGGFPEPLAKSNVADMWFRSYIQTYLERDVRAISSIRDLAMFRRFLSILSSRAGQILNRTDLAAPLGVSVPTISEWLSILEITSQIILVPPYYENFGKRMIKSSKVYFVDSGMLCHLLGIESEKMLFNSPFFGPVFEGFIASEILKMQYNSGKRRELYFFRDQQGLEVDFLVPTGNKKLNLLECKASRTITPQMAYPMKRLEKSVSGYSVNSFIVHLPLKKQENTSALIPGVKAISSNLLGQIF